MSPHQSTDARSTKQWTDPARRVPWFAALAVLGIVSWSQAATHTIRPLTLASGPNYSMVASGTITTAGNTSTITGWDATVTTNSRLARYTPSSTANMSSGPLSCDGTFLMVATSPDGIQDGGLLFFRSPNPYQDFGVAVADFAGMNANGGQAMYMAGAAFDFLPLNQPNNIHYIAATRTTGNVYSLVPINFYGGVRVTGTITTDGTTGPLAPSHILSWDISVDQVTEDAFTTGNSTLLAQLIGLDGTGTALTVRNPGGYLTFSKGYQGGHLYALMLADFSAQSPPGGQAGYFQGSFAVTTIQLNAPPGPWIVTELAPSLVREDAAMSPGLRVSPNPARRLARVEYSLMTAGDVRLQVFDPAGRQVRDLVNVPQSPGAHSVGMDVGDLPSGVYFCRLQADGGAATSKFLVQK